MSSRKNSYAWSLAAAFALTGCLELDPNELDGGGSPDGSTADAGTSDDSATPGGGGFLSGGAAGGSTTDAGTAAGDDTGGWTGFLGGIGLLGGNGLFGGGGFLSGGSDGGGSPGGSAGGISLVKCDVLGSGLNTKPCGSFVSDMGVTLELGPYGGQMDPNVGQGFETDDEGLASVICGLFAASFGAEPEATDRLLDLTGLQMNMFSVYRPVNWPQGKVPIVTWGNGTCAKPEGYGALLRFIASHGFFVVAANNRFVGDGSAQLRGVDFASAANNDPNSPYYGKLDTTRVIAMGHSQGGLGTVAAASDPRVKSAILFNGGTSAPKPFLAISGDRDVSGDVDSLRSAVMSSAQSPTAWIFYHQVPGDGAMDGHLTLMMQPERVGPPAVAWAKYSLLGDAESRTYFAGSNCKLCSKATELEFGQKGIQ